MRTTLTSLIAIFVLATPALANDPYPFQRSDGKWGYVDDEHCWVIEPQFDRAAGFSEGLAAVSNDEGMGYIDQYGNFVLPPPISNLTLNVGDFHDGLARANYLTGSGFKWGFINLRGEFLIRPIFDGASDFSDGMAVVSMHREGSLLMSDGYVASDGTLVVAPRYLLATRFVDGLAAMGDLGKVGFVNKDGEYVIPPVFGYAEEFSEGLAAVSFNGKYGFVNSAGRMVIKPLFDDARSFSQGLAWVSINKKAGFINSDGEIVIAPTFDGAFSFSEGLSAVQIGEKWGYIDLEGHVVIPAIYDFANPFEHGRASVSEGERYFIISKSGQILLDPTCDHTR